MARCCADWHEHRHTHTLHTLALVSDTQTQGRAVMSGMPDSFL